MSVSIYNAIGCFPALPLFVAASSLTESSKRTFEQSFADQMLFLLPTNSVKELG